MNKFTYDVTLVHTLIHTETIRVTVECDNEEDAERSAQDEAEALSLHCSVEAEYQDTEIESVELISHDSDNDLCVVMRCDKTPDMFNEAQANYQTQEHQQEA